MKQHEITRNQFLTSATLGAVSLAVSSCATGNRKPGRKPNFLFILADDLACRAVGYNHPVVQTPNIDRIAGAGIIFDRTYIATPICVASRASLLTGVFPQQHGSVSLDASGFHHSVIEEERLPTIAHALARAGYDTPFCGKSHLGPPRDYGFSKGDELKDISDAESFEFATDYLEQHQPGDAPFLLWMAARQPHIPLKPEPELLEHYMKADIDVDPNFMESPPPRSEFNQGLPGENFYRESKDDPALPGYRSGPPRTREQAIEFMRAYYAVISHLDRQIGALYDTMKATGHIDNTVLVFMSDNGYHLGNHGLGNKITMHEESVHVPMFVHWPGIERAGVRSEALVSSLDLYPTLLDLAGAAIPEHLAGHSLTPLFRNPERQIREYVASECVGVGGVLGMGHRMVRTERWKYILTDTNEEVLYDQANDPYEMANAVAAPENGRVLETMRGHMREWMKEVGDTHQPPPGT